GIRAYRVTGVQTWALPICAGMQLAALRRTDFEQRLGEAQAGFAQAKASLEQAAMDFDRSSKLLDKGAVPRAEVDAARTRRDAARSEERRVGKACRSLWTAW